MGLCSTLRGIFFNAAEKTVDTASDASKSAIKSASESVNNIANGAKGANLGLTLKAVFDPDENEKL